MLGKRNGLSACGLKYLACAAMLIDHIGVLLLPQITALRFVGRLAFPIFAFLIANGFKHSSSVSKYLLRLIIFAALFQWPYQLIMGTFGLNILFTLSTGLLAVIAMNKAEQHIANSPLAFCCCILICAAAAAIAQLTAMDYGWYGIAVICASWIFFGNFPLMALSWLGLTCAYMFIIGPQYQLLALLALIPIKFYDGSRGKGGRWFFYGFYIGHLLLLYLLQLIIF